MSDRLLYALSSKGFLKLEDFYEILSKEWGITTEDSDEKQQMDRRLEVVRLFEALSLVETDWVERRIFVTPTRWALLPSPGLPSAVLVGGRSPSLLRKIRAIYRQAGDRIQLREETRSWMSGAFPSFVFARASSLSTLADFCQQTGRFDGAGPSAWFIANSSISISEMEKKLKFTIPSEPNWRRRIFNLEQLKFFSIGNPSSESYFAEYTNPKTRQKMHIIWKNGIGAEVHRDWGRYLALGQGKKQVLLYDATRQMMGIPATAPLPAIPMRSVAMCSGRLPLREKIVFGLPARSCEILYNVFMQVQEPIANLVSEKLNQPLAEFDIKTMDRSELCSIATR